MPAFDPATTALILVDLQEGIVAMDLAPRTGAETAAAGIALADRFSAAGATVIAVHVDFVPGAGPSQTVDRPMPGGDRPANWSDYLPGVRRDGDIEIVKRHWGAFTGTELDLRLRRLGIRTVAIAGIATNFGVESTARSAWEHGYHVVIVEDACTSASETLHRFAIDNVLPRIARVMHAADIGFG